MAEAPKAFWIPAGIAVLVVAGAFAFRILQGSPGSLDIEGVKVEVSNAQQGISDAQASFAQLTQQAQAQAQEIKRLEERLAQAQARIKELVATIQHLPQAPAAVKGAAQTILSEQASPLPAVPKFDAALLSKTQAQLQQAHASVLRLNATLSAQKR
jgi:predicted transcriptional regulator